MLARAFFSKRRLEPQCAFVNKSPTRERGMPKSEEISTRWRVGLVLVQLQKSRPELEVAQLKPLQV